MYRSYLLHGGWKQLNKYYDSLLKGVNNKLEGYEISSFDGGQRDGITVTITW